MHRCRILAPIGVAFVLAGCSGPFLGDAQLRQLGSALKNDVIGAMQASEYMDQGSAIASSGSGFTTQAITGANYLEAKYDSLRTKWAGALSVMRSLATVSSSTSTTNPDGSVTMDIRFQFDAPRWDSAHHISRTVSGSGALQEVAYEIDRTNSLGQTWHIYRVYKVGDGGAWTGTFDFDITRPGGATKEVYWTRSGFPDGTETSSGTIKRFNGAAVAITITRDPNGSVVAKSTDGTAGLSVEVKKDEFASGANVTVTTKDGRVLSNSNEADTTAVAPSED